MTVTRKWTHSIWRSGVALMLTAGLAAPIWLATEVSAQEQLPDVAAAAPESTVLFHSMDLDREGTQWQLTEELLARVGLPDALDLWEEAALEDGAATGDFTEADLDALLGGEMAIVVTQHAVERVAAKFAAHLERHEATDSGDATPMARSGDRGHGLAAILVPGDPDAAWDYVQGQMTDLAAELGVELEESSYGDAELLTVAKRGDAASSDTEAGDPLSELMAQFDLHTRGTLVAGRAGDYIIVGPHQADVTAIVDAVDGTVGSLADSAEAQAVADELPADALSFTYVDGQGILDALGPELTEALQSYAPEMPQEAWGGQVGFAISADQPGFRFDTISVLGPEGDVDSMLVENDPAVAAAAERAPADTFVFQAGKLPETAYVGAPFLLAQAVNDAMSGAQPGDQAMMDIPTPEEMEEAIATATAALEFDPAADLFDLLGFEFIAFSTFPNINLDSVTLDAVAGVSTTDADALAETAEKIAAFIDRSEAAVEVSTRDVDGDTVYVVSDPEMVAVPAVEFGVVGDLAVIAIGGGIEALTTEPTESLAQDPQFQSVMGQLPSEYYQIGYVDIGQAVDTIVMLMGMLGGITMPEPAATPVAPVGGPENIRALGAVAFQRDGMDGGSAILYIAEP